MQQLGLSLKPQHFNDVLGLTASQTQGLWWEIHPENYFVQGGPRLRAIETIREKFPISLHSVSLNLGGVDPLDQAQLKRLRELSQRFDAFMVSDHLAWQTHQARYYPDLLPIVRNKESLQRIADRISYCQDHLGRKIAIENPTHYMPLPHEYSETEFFAELVKITGCGLLLDMSNVLISAHNLGFDPLDYFAQYPFYAVDEIHLAGYRPDENSGSELWIDSHDAAVDDATLKLYAHFCKELANKPVLIERDGNIPPLSQLLAERESILHTLQ